MTTFFEEKKKRERKSKKIILQVDLKEVEEKFNLPFSDKKVSLLNVLKTSDNLNNQQILSDKRKMKNIFIHSVDLCLNPLPEKTDIWCYWCKHPFNCQPIGCPIKYYIDENLNENIYEIYNIFCGFYCLMAHIKFVKKYIIDEDIYRESDTLINQMYYDIYGYFPLNNELTCAPDWKLLKSFGGSMEIEDFRKCNENVCITTTNSRVRPFPIMISSTEIFQKTCIF